jgi:hypothetical protein
MAQRRESFTPQKLLPGACPPMKRLTALSFLFAAIAVSSILAQPAHALGEFGKVWSKHYLGKDADPDFTKAMKKEGCNICHLKGEKKDKRNEYGQALDKFLDKKEFPKDYYKNNEEEATKKIVEALKKAEAEESKSGQKFGDRIKANEKPASE